MIKAVVLDIGETLLDDTREWAAWADWMGVPRHTLSALVGALVATGRDNREVFLHFKPDFDLEVERRAREAAGLGQVVTETDLYPDVRPALAALRDLGLWVGIAGNQTARVGDMLRELRLPADAIATSGEWGVGKPNREFFDRVAQLVPVDRSEVLYVGDHRDFDIVAGGEAGFATAMIRRGPWGYFWYNDLTVRASALRTVESLSDLAEWLKQTLMDGLQ